MWAQQCGKRGLDTTPVGSGSRRGAGGRQGLAGQRVDAPSEARGADGSRAGRHPPAHTATRHHRCGGRRRDRRARAGFETTHRDTHQHASRRRCGGASEGPEGTGGLRDNAPRHTPACQSPPMWRAPEGPVGLAAVPVGGGGAWTAPHSTEGATGVEGVGGTGGPGCGARGRWRGLDGTTQHRRRHRRGGRRRVRRARAGFEIDHSEPQARVWRSRGRPGPTAPGTPVGPQATQAGRPPPTGTPSSPAQQHTTRRPERQRRHKKHSTGARAHRPAPLDATTQTRQLRSTCVPYRSARAARRWRRSSRSPRLRRRAGPRR